MTAALAFKNVCQQFGTRTALRQVSLEIRSGEIYGIAGANGSGKTTLLRIGAGAINPSRGEILVQGETGYVAQRFALYDDLLVEENLTFFSRCQGLSGAKLAAAVSRSLNRFGLGGLRRKRTGHLSHGWKQRLAIAVALAHQPSVLILDEATSGIDLEARAEIWDELTACASSGVGILLATHDMEEASRCHRLGYLRDGELIVSAKPDELQRQFAGATGRQSGSLSEMLLWFARGAVR